MPQIPQSSYESEIKQLESLIAEVRSTHPRRPFSSDIRSRVLRLRRAGVSVAFLSNRLGLARSMFHAWGKQSSTAMSTMPAPAVLQVEPRAIEPEPYNTGGASTLHLRVGGFAVTIVRAE